MPTLPRGHTTSTLRVRIRAQIRRLSKARFSFFGDSIRRLGMEIARRALVAWYVWYFEGHE